MNGEDPAVRIAQARSAQAVWAMLPVKTRARRLRALRRAIAQRVDEIVHLLCDEVGKTAMDALTGDVMVTLEQLRFYERHAARILRSTRPGKPWFFYRGTRFVQSYEPHGVVLIFAPWNYPLQLAVIPMASALFAGNGVLLKCSERTPRTTQLIEELCDSVDLPQGLVQISCEPPQEAEPLLGARPDFVFFTGSARNGRMVAEKAAPLMIPTIMELGGKDAALVFDSCDINRTVEGLVYGSFANAGQVCVGTKRIFVQSLIYEDFLRRFLERVGTIRVGAGEEGDMSHIGFADVRLRLSDQVEDAVRRGSRLHAGSVQVDTLTPIVLTEVPEDSSLLREESFGPVVCVAPFDREDDAIRLADASTFQLSASVWTETPRRENVWLDNFRVERARSTMLFATSETLHARSEEIEQVAMADITEPKAWLDSRGSRP